MAIFAALAWHLRMALMFLMRLFSSPNPGGELVESLHLGAAELFPKPIFGFLRSVVRGIVCQHRELRLFHDLSPREFRTCGSLS
jgi:hypothetical protein